MARKTYSIEQIIVILRKMEVLCGQGRSAEEAARRCENPLNWTNVKQVDSICESII